MSETCVTEGDWEKERDKQTDLGSGFWPLYCIFQWRLHIPETRPHDWRDGGCGGGSNYCWAKLNRRSDWGVGGVELRRVADYLCVAFPSSDKRPCSHKQGAGPNSILHRAIKGFRDDEKPLNINIHKHNDTHQKSLSRSTKASRRYISQTVSPGGLNLHRRG